MSSVSCPALSSPALPCLLASQPVCFFPYGVVFVCSFVLLIKAFFLQRLGLRSLPFTPALTERTHHEEDPAEEGLVPAITSLHTIQPPLRGHSPVQGPALPPSAGYWRKDVCPEVQRYSRGVGVQPCGTEGHVQQCPRWAPQLVEDEGAGSPSVLGVCGVPDSFPSDGGWSTSSGSRGGRPGARCRPGGCSRAGSSPGAHRARSSGGQRSCSALSSVGWSCSAPSCDRWSSSAPSGGRRGCGIPLSEAEEEEEEGFFPPSRPGGRSRAVCWPGGHPWVAQAPRAAQAPRPAGAAQAPRPAGATQAPRPAAAAQAPRPAGATQASSPAGASQVPRPAGATQASCPAGPTLAACQAASSPLASWQARAGLVCPSGPALAILQGSCSAGSSLVRPAMAILQGSCLAGSSMVCPSGSALASCQDPWTAWASLAQPSRPSLVLLSFPAGTGLASLPPSPLCLCVLIVLVWSIVVCQSLCSHVLVLSCFCLVLGVPH